MRTLRFDVDGIPKPKGSLKHVGHGRLVEQVDNKAWKRAVTISAAVVRDQDGWKTAVDVPVRVHLSFSIPVVASDKKRRYPTKRSSGDLDKLTRLVFDCLTEAKIIGDDSQIVEMIVGKWYARHDTPGVSVSVQVIE